jgi:hypothetical protein
MDIFNDPKYEALLELTWPTDGPEPYPEFITPSEKEPKTSLCKNPQKKTVDWEVEQYFRAKISYL